MKNIKDFILEGAWGYEPDQNDSTLDLRGNIFLSICELIYDKCNDAPNIRNGVLNILECHW